MHFAALSKLFAMHTVAKICINSGRARQLQGYTDRVGVPLSAVKCVVAGDGGFADMLEIVSTEEMRFAGQDSMNTIRPVPRADAPLH